MPSLKITAYQKVYYEKIIDLSQQACDEILAAPGPDDQQRALEGHGGLPENEHITDYGDYERLTVTAFAYPV